MAYPLSDYLALLRALAAQGLALAPMGSWFGGLQGPTVFLRHDVDRLPARAIAMAEGEAGLGVAATYYFRCDPRGRFPGPAIQGVAALGHEIGFHYECLSRSAGDSRRAQARFAVELETLRGLAQVLTVAPHGAPASAHSNMAFARSIDHRAQGLLGDASLIADPATLYVTDTGGTFGSPHNRRDRPPPGGRMLESQTAPGALAARLRSAGESRILLSCHPERWPLGLPGLIQAGLQDALVNLAKRLVARGARAGA